MDLLDLRIMRDIGIEPFAGSASPHPWRPEELARRLNESPRLVKDRMARLERAGVVAGFDVLPNLALLGLSSRTYAFPFALRAGRGDVIQLLSGTDGVLAVVDYVTDWIAVDIAFANEEEHQTRLAAVSAILSGLRPDTWFELSVPPKIRDLSRLDWRILRALRGNARISMSDLAGRLGVSTKTVQRRLDQMATGRAFSAFAVLNAASLDELLMCSLVVRVDTSDMAKLRSSMADLHQRLLADAWAHCSAPVVQDGIHYDLVAVPRTPRALAELLEGTAQAPGVLEVKAHLASSVTWPSTWLNEQIDGRIQALG